MKSRRVVFVALLFSCFVVRDVLAATYTLEAVSGAPEGARAELRSTLQPQGYRVLNEKGAIWCEVWIRQEVPNLAKPASPEAKYQTLHEGQLLGMMKFHAAGSDYRGQAIKPGLYTLRYAVMLQDGNHLGVSPILDFVLLIPAADDTKEADAVLSSEEVVALSRKASGTNHPAVISLASPPDAAGCGTLEKDDANHWVLKVKSQSKPDADLPIGIIVVGRAEG